MDILAIVLACSLHPDDALVRTVIDVQSSGNVYFVGDLKTLKSKDWLKSADAALQYAEELRGQGGRPAVGLLGIPLEWASRYGRAPIELFDACTNVAVATAVFSEYSDRCARVSGSYRGHRPPLRAPRVRQIVAQRYCVLSLFAHDLGLRAAPSEVLRRLVDEGLAPTRAPEASPAAASSVFESGRAEESSATSHLDSASLFMSPPAVAPSSRSASAAGSH